MSISADQADDLVKRITIYRDLWVDGGLTRSEWDSLMLELTRALTGDTSPVIELFGGITRDVVETRAAKGSPAAQAILAAVKSK